MNKIRSRQKIKNRWNICWMFQLIILLLIIAFLAAGSACSKTQKEEIVILDFSSVNEATSSSAPTIDFNETNSYVLRCTSLTTEDNRITAVVTKAKSASIEALIFVNTEDFQPSAEIAWVNLNSCEKDYDISKASYRMVSLSKAKEAVEQNGLPYDDWMIGTLSQDELFPCCK